jgi:1-acyl-sn-glycerol-3-phosphate acyltransferase
MKQTLDAGVRLVLFPEGTSTGGETVLPFKPALFESAIDTGQQIIAARLKYELDSANASQVVCYWGEMTFVPHLLGLMREKHVRAVVTFDRAGQIFNDRKSAAQVLHQRVIALEELAVEAPHV